MGSSLPVRLESPTRSFPAAVFVAAGCVYAWLVPLAPGFGDAAELGAAAQLLGVPHPTGFPLDVLLLRLGAYLPLGAISFRQNLLVALISASCVALLAELTRRVSRRLGADVASARVGGVLAAVALGSWATFLGTGLSVEVYSTALALVLLGALELSRARPRVVVIGALVGLSLAAHVSARVGLAPLLLVALLGRGTRRLGPRCGLTVGVTLGLGALIVYLPLASLANPALDWGDPETLGRLWGHLDAERIRTAYAGAMLGVDGAAMGRFLAQLAELGLFLIPASVGWLGLLRVRRRAALLLAGVFVLDLAYACFINPMGIADRQVGHLAGACLCLAAGLGVAALLARLAARPSSRRLGLALATSLAVLAVLAAPAGLAQDGSAESELLGSGSSLMDLPPRAVFVCHSDDVCAGALFARYAEWSRPDLSVVVAQHLWEPAERRRLGSRFPRIVALGQRRPMTGSARGQLAAQVEAWLSRSSAPVFFEAAPEGAPSAMFVASRVPPFLCRADGPYVAFPPERALSALDVMLAARLGSVSPTQHLARGAYARAAGRLGKGLLAAQASELSVRAFERAVALDPGRAAGFTNLGVARA
ncbi:MAG: DUF2723 domain-containing protein, partial [Deltaproteobacteria bacterium]|nr:DUF2723 domain-containing protein [Deltaproteobacteria bacterium]